MKTTFFNFLFLFIIVSSCAEKSVCENYKKGEFYELVLSYPVIGKKVVRNGNIQTSTITLRNGKTTASEIDFYTIEWINDCDYILKIDESKMEMNEDMQEINRNGGILHQYQWNDNTYIYYKGIINLDNYQSTFEQKTRIE